MQKYYENLAVQSKFTLLPAISDPPQMKITVPAALENYTGNKKVEGLYHSIINLIPPHKLYVEPFAGSAAIFRMKKLADHTIINDLNKNVIAAWKKHLRSVQIEFTVSSGIKLIEKLKNNNELTFAYCDPPYRHSSRYSKKQLYDQEMTDSEHEEFISLASTVNFNCMISHYPDSVYDNAFKHWNKKDISVSVRGRVQIERLYFNYDFPDKLHDYSYVGNDCWDRQRIKRKINREIKKLLSLPANERNAIIEAVQENKLLQ